MACDDLTVNQCRTYAQLLERVVFEILEAEDVEEANVRELGCLHNGYESANVDYAA